MSKTQLPKAESQRLKTLQKYALLDTVVEKKFDDIVQMATAIMEAPIALISLVDKERQWFKAKVGLETCETHRDVAFCAHAILSDEVFEIEDALADERFRENPLVLGEPNIRYYIGIPLVIDGHSIGTLCVIDKVPRKATEKQIDLLKRLGVHTVSLVRDRKQRLIRRVQQFEMEKLSKMLQYIHSLNCKSFESISDMLSEYIQVGIQEFGLEVGIVSEVLGNNYVVRGVHSPDDGIKFGDYFELEQTYCEAVVKSKKTMSYINIGVDESMSGHPCYKQTNLECYIGTPIWVSGKVYGTLNFSSLYEKDEVFTQAQTSFIEILAQAIGRRIELDMALFETEKTSKAIEAQFVKLKQQSLDNEILRYSSELGMWKWNLADNSMEFDRRWCQMLGYGIKELEPNNTTWVNLMHPDEIKSVRQDIENFIAGRTNKFDIVYRMKTKGGSWIPILCKGKVIERNIDGNPSVLWGTHLDLTNFESLKEEKEKLEAVSKRVQSIARIGGWEIDLINNNISMSPEIYKIYGVEEDGDFSIEQGMSYYAEHDRERIKTCVENCQKNLVPYDEDFEFYDANGVHKWIRTFGEPVVNQEGKVIGMRGFFQDISESKRKNEEIIQLKQKAEKANETKTQFLTNMSHELRTPLNAIIGYSDFLVAEMNEGEVDIDQLKVDLGKINKSGHHLLTLINQILDLAKVESGKMDLFLEPVIISSLCEEVKNLVSPLISDNKNTFNFEIKDNLKHFNCDNTKLKQILLNLISNAAKFTQNGEIKLMVSQVPGEKTIQFDVIDSGIGIPEDKLENIFSEFSQVDNSTTRLFSGTGLGLSICKKFSQLMGGQLTVTSKEGEGSCFSLTLPLEISLSSISSLVEKNQNVNLDNESILIVEDDPRAREILKRSLSSLDVAILEVDTGERGFEMAKGCLPDLIVLDIALPMQSGWDTLVDLKTHYLTREIPVLIVSMISERAKGLRLGASDYLEKPVSREVLLEKVRKLIWPSEGIALVVDDDPNIRNLVGQNLESGGFKVLYANDGKSAIEKFIENKPEVIVLDLIMPGTDGFDFLTQLEEKKPDWNFGVIVLTGKILRQKEKDMLAGLGHMVVRKGEDSPLELVAAAKELLVKLRSAQSIKVRETGS